jgi:hypothetical protein
MEMTKGSIQRVLAVHTLDSDVELSEDSLSSGSLGVSVSLGRMSSVALDGEESRSGLDLKLFGVCVSSVVLRCVVAETKCCVLSLLMVLARLLEVFSDCTGVPKSKALVSCCGHTFVTRISSGDIPALTLLTGGIQFSTKFK